ncbi:aminoglycoside phosphotransferase family protein [Microbacterium sp. WCS2018Hpa-23]|uniref:aminoglycoside phosphotransferase family protein n=1 Tax=Microbacterium sp. WCS2018Hpa-23 TaxID=3073634 RepID=UPI0028834237|nr:aminoglycoside phosphotransferase family protein [Microbacterium sp. WCS2018Hpa-23]
MGDSPSAEYSLDEDGVRALLRAAAPQLADLPLSLFAEGWDNAMWSLGADLVVRVPRRALAVPLIANEQRALPEIGPALAVLGIRTPAPVLAGAPNDVFPRPWSVIPWIEGSNALASSRVENASWAPRLAEALRALHAPAPDDAPVNPVRGRELTTRDGAMRPRLDALPPRSALRDAWAGGLAATPSVERVWIHGDLHPGNILVREGSLEALIDFGDVSVGDPAYDLASAWMLFDAPGREAFRAATRSRYDDATWVRARAWAAYIALVLLTQSDDRPDHFAVGQSTAEELESD